MSRTGKSAIFIDGANLYSATKQNNLTIDFKRLLDFYKGRGHLLRAFYFTALHGAEEHDPVRTLTDWLDYNGYQVVSKRTKSFTTDDGRRSIKGNMDLEIAITALEMAPHIDEMILFSGDGDFRILAEAMQRRGVRVTVVSSRATTAADELVRQADEFVELDTLRPHIERRSPDRAQHVTRPEINGRSRTQDCVSSSGISFVSPGM